jgi:hypothetical protein
MRDHVRSRGARGSGAPALGSALEGARGERRGDATSCGRVIPLRAGSASLSGDLLRRGLW